MRPCRTGASRWRGGWARWGEDVAAQAVDVDLDDHEVTEHQVARNAGDTAALGTGQVRVVAGPLQRVRRRQRPLRKRHRTGAVGRPYRKDAGAESKCGIAVTNLHSTDLRNPAWGVGGTSGRGRPGHGVPGVGAGLRSIAHSGGKGKQSCHGFGRRPSRAVAGRPARSTACRFAAKPWHPEFRSGKAVAPGVQERQGRGTRKCPRCHRRLRAGAPTSQDQQEVGDTHAAAGVPAGAEKQQAPAMAKQSAGATDPRSCLFTWLPFPSRGALNRMGGTTSYQPQSR